MRFGEPRRMRKLPIIGFVIVVWLGTLVGVGALIVESILKQTGIIEQFR